MLHASALDSSVDCRRNLLGSYGQTDIQFIYEDNPLNLEMSARESFLKTEIRSAEVSIAAHPMICFDPMDICY